MNRGIWLARHLSLLRGWCTSAHSPPISKRWATAAEFTYIAFLDLFRLIYWYLYGTSHWRHKIQYYYIISKHEIFYARALEHMPKLWWWLIFEDYRCESIWYLIWVRAFMPYWHTKAHTYSWLHIRIFNFLIVILFYSAPTKTLKSLRWSHYLKALAAEKNERQAYYCYRGRFHSRTKTQLTFPL